ncbi:hypothetical protein QKA_2219 [Clostridioides difficile DA00165]|nr:hypothetical protein QKA_2219 [Clostridioides difficile DA00165]
MQHIIDKCFFYSCSISNYSPFLKKFLLLFRKSTTNLGYIDNIIKSAFLNNSLPVVHPFFMIFAFSAFFKVSKSTSTPNTFSYPAF